MSRLGTKRARIIKNVKLEFSKITIHNRCKGNPESTPRGQDPADLNHSEMKSGLLFASARDLNRSFVFTSRQLVGRV